jgi:hypothetical protein
VALYKEEAEILEEKKGTNYLIPEIEEERKKEEEKREEEKEEEEEREKESKESKESK